jgi:hypothetical protein
MITTTAQWLRSAGLDALELRLRARHATWVWALLAVALVARTVVAAVSADVDPAMADLIEYGSIARTTLEHGRGEIDWRADMMPGNPAGTPPFVFPTAFMSPFLIFVWVALFLLFGTGKLALAMMIALNVLTGVGIVYYSIRVARALFGSEVIALLTGIVMALNPVFVFSAATYHAVNVYLLLLLIMFDMALSTRRLTYPSSVLIGVLAGITVLARLEYVVLVGAIILGSLITHRQWKKTAVAAFAALIIVAPWTARNYVVFHRFIPVANQVGYTLFLAYNPEANGSGKSVDNNAIVARLLDQELNRVPLDRNYENARDKVLYDAAIDYMRSHPLRSFVVLPMYRAALFWIYDVHHPVTHQMLYQLQFWPLFALSIVGLVIAVRRGCFVLPDHRTVLVLFAFQTLVIMSYTVYPRYRMNVEPFLYAYAAVGAVGVWGWLHRLLGISRDLRTLLPEATISPSRRDD